MLSSRQIALIAAGVIAILCGLVGGLRFPLFSEIFLNIPLYGIAVIVGVIALLIAIEDLRQGILATVGVIAMSLGIVGGVSYPLAYDNIVQIILYEALLAFGILGCLLLVNERGLEEE
jgi:hypothetical protein